jgi:hypothetical protein
MILFKGDYYIGFVKWKNYMYIYVHVSIHKLHGKKAKRNEYRLGRTFISCMLVYLDTIPSIGGHYPIHV